jgi:hypothetical protein
VITGKPRFIKNFLIIVGVTKFQASAMKCMADNTWNFIDEP